MKKLLFAVPFIALFTSCHYFHHTRIDGNGQVKTENRNLSGFSSIDVSSNIDILITQDSVNSLQIETDDNLMSYIETSVDGNVLRIRTRDGYELSGSKGIKAHVHVTKLTAVDASGSCDILGQNPIVATAGLSIDISGSSDVKMDITAPKVEASLSGSGKIELTGQTTDLKVDGSGSTDIQCPGLKADNVSVSISGSGNADVSAASRLEVDISGSADVKYHGNPQVKQSVSGSGTIVKAD